jgi:organic radical activating enzyme
VSLQTGIFRDDPFAAFTARANPHDAARPGDGQFIQRLVQRIEHRLHQVCDVLFSPSAAQLPARELADWIVAERLPVRFQMQLHKLLWNDEPGR